MTRAWRRLKKALFRTLQGRLVISYVVLSVAVHLLVFHVLGVAMRGSLEQGIQRFMDEMVERDASFEQAQKRYADGDYAVNRFYFRLVDPGGAVALAEGPSIAGSEALREALRPGERRADTLEASPSTTLRVVSRRYDDGAVIQAGVLIDQDRALFREFARHWWMGFVFLAVIAAGLSWWMVRSAMAGVKEVTRTAEEILEGKLVARVPERQQVAEVQELTGTINRMLDKIDLLITDLKFVTVDVAHDLRSPLTRIRGSAEVALRAEASAETQQHLAVRVIEETTRLEALVETMLEIVRLDSAADALPREPVDTGALLAEMMDLYAEAAEGHGIALRLAGGGADGEPPPVEMERTMLQRTLANLLDNALKFTPQGGSVELGAAPVDGDVVLFVRDTGPGIPAEDLPRIFERFYRADGSRRSPGHGLGLSYAKSAVSAYGGRVDITSPPRGGTRVEVRLPRAGSPSSGSPSSEFPRA
ncbi:MAG: ATP-binding protein [Acidobacteriota bacterium]